MKPTFQPTSVFTLLGKPLTKYRKLKKKKKKKDNPVNNVSDTNLLYHSTTDDTHGKNKITTKLSITS